MVSAEQVLQIMKKRVPNGLKYRGHSVFGIISTPEEELLHVESGPEDGFTKLIPLTKVNEKTLS